MQTGNWENPSSASANTAQSVVGMIHMYTRICNLECIHDLYCIHDYCIPGNFRKVQIIVYFECSLCIQKKKNGENLNGALSAVWGANNVSVRLLCRSSCNGSLSASEANLYIPVCGWIKGTGSHCKCAIAPCAKWRACISLWCLIHALGPGHVYLFDIWYSHALVVINVWKDHVTAYKKFPHK